MLMFSIIYVAALLPVVGDDNIVPLYALETLFGNVAGVVIGFAGIVLFIMLLIGGFKYLTSAGNPQSLDSAKKTITYAVLGLILIVLSYVIIVFIADVTGQQNLLNFTVGDS